LFHKLYAEAAVRIELPTALVVPRAAVLSPGRDAVVYVDHGDLSYEQRRVKLGRASDDDWEVLEGLNEGERVVTAGNLLIDAQTQLNSGSAGATHVHGATTSTGPSQGETGVAGVTLPSLTDEQRAAARQFLAFADALTAALAADNLSLFSTEATKAHSAAAALGAVFPTENPWHALVARIASTAHLSAANDLKQARRAFNPFSDATVALAKALRRRETEFKSLKIYRCPMTKDAFPGAPRTAEWLQTQTQIRNPYFGAEMLDCGSEVKP
jgi:Cu(I)/Ag(I) efflux system membrane fusion protein